MLRPYPMSKITVVCTTAALPKVVSEMHSLKVIHITEHAKNEFADIGKPFGHAAGVADLLVKAKSVIASLSMEESKPKIIFKNYREVESSVLPLYEKTSQLTERLNSIKEELARRIAFKEKLSELAPLNIPLEAFSTYSSISYFVFFAKNAEALGKKISEITSKFEMHFFKADRLLLVALFIEKAKESEVKNLLDAPEFTLADASMLIGLKGSVQQNIKDAEAAIAKLEKTKYYIERTLQYLGKKHAQLLNAATLYLEAELEKAEAPLRFAETKDAAVVKGWLPSADLEKSVEMLKKAAKGKIHIIVEEPAEKDDVPVKLKNPQPAKPFEFLLNLYSLPLYREFDPTVPIFLIFPLLFGFMLGDIGYGIAGFVASLALKKFFSKSRAVASLMNVVMLSSFVSVVFGMIFGEFFGAEHVAGFGLPHILNRIEDINALIYIAVGIGVLHINLGLVLGFINEAKLHGVLHAIYAKLSWILLQLGMILLILPYLKVIDIPLWLGFAFLASSILMIIKGEGFIGIIEMPGILSNVLSYARLGAVGLSSVALAIMINKLASGLFQKGGFFILIGVLIILIGHALNLVVGMFESFLHSLRLNYVEFFTKFYKGGGIEYNPFGSEKQKGI